MRPFTRDDLLALLSPHDTPCVSLYVPTQRGVAHAHENALRYKNACREAERGLAAFPAAAVAGVSQHLAALESPGIWGTQRDTLAVFATPHFTARYMLAESFPASVTVADTFLTKCLVKYMQGEVKYYLLTLTRENVTLFEGNREQLDPVTVPGMPRGLRDLEPARTPEQGVSGRLSGAGSTYYGSGAGGEVDGKDALRALFRAVDRALMPVTQSERIPVILATHEQYHTLFHEVSKNPYLLEERIVGDPEQLGKDALRDRALAILKPRREQTLKDLAAQYLIAVDRKRGTNYLPNIAQAAVQGRVQILLIEDGRTIPGGLDRTTGEVTRHPTSGTGQDALDDVGELVLAAGGAVYVLPREMMPTDVGVAAIYRY